MRQDRQKWNQKYLSHPYSYEPSGIVKKYAKLASGKKALDIAAGNGRNAIFLARQGFVVDAVDIADAGLAKFAGKHPGVHPICADLDDFDIPANRYDLIVNIKYLNRRLFPYIREGLTKDGVLIFETFLASPDPANEQPISRDYLLQENELLHAFASLKIVLYQEADETDHDETAHLASLVGIKIH
ncbi:MAG: methyltransferase domain-containing protein [Desulfobacterales bacterium]|jgi:tellurite methyltransferase